MLYIYMITMDKVLQVHRFLRVVANKKCYAGFIQRSTSISVIKVSQNPVQLLSVVLCCFLPNYGLTIALVPKVVI